MPMIRCRDADGVDVVTPDHVFILFGGDAFDIEPFAAVMIVDDLLRVVPAVGIDVTDGDDLGVVPEEIAEETAALFAHSDESHRQWFRFHLVGGAETMWKNEGGTGGAHGGFEKFAA